MGKRGPKSPLGRDAEIVRMRREEQLPYAAIAAKFGLTRERVRQVISDLAPELTGHTRKSFQPRNCVVCTKEFTPKRQGRHGDSDRRITCSDRCLRQARGAKSVYTAAQRKKALALFKRGGMTDKKASDLTGIPTTIIESWRRAEGVLLARSAPRLMDPELRARRWEVIDGLHDEGYTFVEIGQILGGLPGPSVRNMWIDGQE